MPGGRPKKNFEPWKNWQEDILEWFADGMSKVEVRVEIIKKMKWKSLSNDLWFRWMDEEKEFSETIKMGELYSQAFWEGAGREGLSSKEFSYVGWFMNMKNRFPDDWRDKKEIDNSHKIEAAKVEFGDEEDELEA